MPADAWVALPLTVAAALALGLTAQRLLGARLGPVRLVLTGLFALTMLPLITTAMVRPDRETAAADLEAMWLVVLGGVCTVLASMAFVVVLEALAPLGSLPPAPAWGAGARARLRRARRYCQLVVLTVRHVAWPLWRVRRSPAASERERQQRYGKVLRVALERAGPSFVKLGQLASGQSDLVPAPVRAELATLQTATTPMPWSSVQGVLERELGPHLGGLGSVDRCPLAAASLGQVHGARLADARAVVVKVQRPGIALSFERDLDIVVHLAAALERRTRWGRRLGVGGLAEDLRRAAREELDYRVEAANLATLGAAGHAVPAPVHELTTSRVLTMARLSGRTLAQAVHDDDLDTAGRARIADAVVAALWHQVLVVGCFHADPHAGNVVVTEAGEVSFLDVGTVGRLDSTQRHHLHLLLVGYLHDDRAGIAHHLLALCRTSEVVDRRELDHLVGRVLVHPLRTTNASQALTGLLDVATTCGLRVPGEVAAVARTFVTVEGVLRQLTPAFDLIASSTRAVRQITAGVGARAAAAVLAGPVDSAVSLVDRLSRDLATVPSAATAASAGPASADGPVGGRVTQHAIVTGLASVTGLMGVGLLATPGGPPVSGLGLHHLLAYYLLSVSGILGLRVLVQVFRATGRERA